MATNTVFDGGSPNTAITLTIPSGGVSMKVSIFRLYAARTASLAVAASALLRVSSTNLPDGFDWEIGNGIAAFGRSVDFDMVFPHGLEAVDPNTPVTITFPAAGLGVSWRALAVYAYVGA